MGKFIMNGVPYGGGDVEANPSGTATDTLTKLGIEGTVYEIQGGGGSNLIVDAQIYSTEERVVGVWTDGKPLYQKVFTFSPTITIDGSWYKFDNEAIYMPIKGTALQTASQACYEVYVDVDSDGAYVKCISGTYTGIDAIILLYTKTTDSAGSGGYQAYGFSPIIYSTEEREVGVWTDNKPLYQKTFYFELTAATFYLDLSPLNAENVVYEEGYVIHNNGKYKLDLPYYEDNNYKVYTNRVTDGMNALAFYAGNGILTWYKNGVITLQYTKTTDTAGSGEYNTLGIPNVHYDGNEKVIGTWFGETLYQQCIDLSSITISAGSTVTVATIQGINLKKALGTLTETDDTTYAIPDGGLRVKQYGDDIKLTAMSGSSWVIASGKLILQYTKTI